MPSQPLHVPTGVDKPVAMSGARRRLPEPSPLREIGSGRRGANTPASTGTVMPPRTVLVPVLIVGGLLCFICLLVPGYLRPGVEPQLFMAANGVVSLALGVLTWWRGATPGVFLVLVIWADIAIVGLSRTTEAPGAAICLVILGLPAVFSALYGGRRLFAAQTAIATVGAAMILEQVGGTPGGLVFQSLVFALATSGPTGTVLLLRERLERHAESDRVRATTDHLTGVMNRHGLEEAVPPLRRRAREGGRPVGVVVLDVDHFKRVNDRYGHAIGDNVLRTVARALVKEVGEDGMVGRLGGEEFVVLTTVPPADLVLMAERLRSRVASDGTTLGVTASVGVAWTADALAEGDPVERMWELVDRADELMYAAKRNGRDQVRAAPA